MKTRLLRRLRNKAELRYKVALWDGWWCCFEKVGSTWQPLPIKYLLPISYRYDAYRTEAEALKAINLHRRQYILDSVRPSIHRRNRLRLQIQH